jgi:microcompartment protein CcmK/EutM
MAPTSDGRYLIIAGTPYLLVVRTADLKVVRLVDLNTTDPIQEVVVDSAGGAGYGPAVLVVTANRFRALRLGSVLEGAL